MTIIDYCSKNIKDSAALANFIKLYIVTLSKLFFRVCISSNSAFLSLSSIDKLNSCCNTYLNSLSQLPSTFDGYTHDCTDLKEHTKDQIFVYFYKNVWFFLVLTQLPEKYEYKNRLLSNIQEFAKNSPVLLCPGANTMDLETRLLYHPIMKLGTEEYE